MKRLSVTLAGTMLLAALGYVIAAEHPSPPPTTLTDGRPLEALVEHGDSSIVLAFNPGNCFKCDVLLALWTEWRDLHPSRFALVLTRVATKDEQDKMRMLNLKPAGTVKRRPLAWLLGSRYEQWVFLVAEGHIVSNEPASSTYQGLPIERYARDELQLHIDENEHGGGAVPRTPNDGSELRAEVDTILKQGR